MTTTLSIGLVALGAFSVDTGEEAVGVLASWWPVLLVLLLQGTALLGSIRAPAAVLGIAAALPMALTVVDLTQISSVTTIPIVVAAYLAGIRTRWVPLRNGVAIAAVAMIVTASIGAARFSPLILAVVGASTQTVLLLAAPLAAAYVVVTRRRLVSALRAENAALDRMQRALLAAAIAEERAGIARELHDIAAHHMSGIALMCAAVERQVDTDRTAAKTGMQQIRRQSRLVLGDLRGVVGLLRGGEDQGVEAHRIDAVQDLISAREAAGEPVQLRVSTREADAPVGNGVGPLAHLVGYRMMQEALANAARHAPDASCEVHIDDTAPAFLLVTVRNGPPTRASDPQPVRGFGLRGMRERAELVRGVLHYGATADGGWEVSLKLARTEAVDEGDDS